MARRPNYSFQKQQQDLKKRKKREEKEAKKRLKTESQDGIPLETDEAGNEDA